MPFIKKLNDEIINNKFINIVIILYLLAIILPFNFNQIFGYLIPENNFGDILGNRTINAFIQIILITIYFFKLITRNIFLDLDGFAKSIVILFFYSLFLNLFSNEFSLKELINIQMEGSYYIKYFMNISIFLILINEFKSNLKLIKFSINIIIFSSIVFSILMIITQILGFPVLGISDLLFNATGYIDNNYSRLTFYGWNENELALFFNLAIAFTINKIIEKKSIFNYKKIFNLITCFILINGLILTGSRMGLITLLFCILSSLLYIFYIKLNIKNNILNLTFISSATTARINFFANSTKKRFEIFDSKGEINENLAQLGGKLQKWTNSYDIGSQDPIVGTGILDFINTSSKGLPENLFLEIFVTSGLGGSIILIIILFLFLKNNFIFFIKYSDLQNMLLVICLFGGMISLNIIYLKSFWFVLAICYAKTKINYKFLESESINYLQN